MQLNVYAGNKKIVTLVQHYTKDPVLLKPIYNAGYVAVPGRKIVTEKQVRTWAKEWGYTIKKTYEVTDRENIMESPAA